MAILSGQYVGSAAEDFVQLMKENNRAVIVWRTNYWLYRGNLCSSIYLMDIKL